MPVQKTNLIILILLLGMSLIACGPEKQVPEAPEETQPQAAAAKAQRTSKEEAEALGKGEYAGWGAHAGTTDILARLAKCNQSGFFFDRAAENGKGACDESKKVLGNCNSFDSVKELTKMNKTQISNIEKHMAEGGLLDGFLFDQCVDGATTNHIWLVKQSKDGTIGIKRLNVDKPA